MSTLEQAAVLMLKALHETGIPHMLVGGFTTNYYGIARSTKDVDIVVELPSRAPLLEVEKRLPSTFEFDSQITFETITGNLRHIVHIKGTPFVIELFELRDEPFQKERFHRRKELYVPQLDIVVTIPTAEDVVIQKLRWGRSKDIDDARDVLAVQADRLDYAYIEDWCRKLGRFETYQQVRATVPNI
ncbi:nucleotidyltransferase DUF2204 [Prosthecobacter fusiformis]|uniref:Nucleotidyltransferase DUF2204 n=1 Tax=Prosthecobacter fusiformis TaxID=48464 RepID=A0A4R7S7D6_9BACT|nr:nucleotidyltransferase [Prosthecobacter fusiformis]TDU73137.1 nucleotidyltransferase DUF2204 [Prosthecobacter fusiformis]